MRSRARARPHGRTEGRGARWWAAGVVGLLLLVAGGCDQATSCLDVRQEAEQLQRALRDRDDRLAAQQATIDELTQQLGVARRISEDDLKRIYYPERLEIDRLTGGYELDGQPGDDGVTVYLKPIDRYGDVLKVAGDVVIQLYDLAAPPGENLIGQYPVGIDQLAKLWHGQLMTGHYTVKCPWPDAAHAPRNPEITVRAVFVDYLTKRVVSAQSTCTVKLRPAD